MQKSLFGENHANLVLLFENIGKSYYNMEDYTKAIQNFEQALAIQISLLGENHEDIGN